jgi:hypothetical protein
MSLLHEINMSRLKISLENLPVHVPLNTAKLLTSARILNDSYIECSSEQVNVIFDSDYEVYDMIGNNIDEPHVGRAV